MFPSVWHISDISKFFQNTLLRVEFLNLFLVFGNVVKKTCVVLRYIAKTCIAVENSYCAYTFVGKSQFCFQEEMF